MQEAVRALQSCSVGGSTDRAERTRVGLTGRGYLAKFLSTRKRAETVSLLLFASARSSCIVCKCDSLFEILINSNWPTFRCQSMETKQSRLYSRGQADAACRVSCSPRRMGSRISSNTASAMLDPSQLEFGLVLHD